MARKNSFYTRGFSTFVVVLSFLMLMVSGSILYVAPKGRVANWTGWSVWGLEKEQWGSLHINIAVLFLVIAALHIFFNWKVLLNYIRSRRTTGFRLKKELFASLAVLMLFTMGTLGEWQPFHSVIVLREDIKAYWDANTQAAPVPHAEDMALSEFAEHVNLSGDQVVTRLRDRGLTVTNKDAKVGEVASANGLKPVDIYSRLQKGRGQGVAAAELSPGGFAGGGGYGWMTVAALCDREGLEATAAIGKLREMGIEAQATSNLRELANALGTTPGKLAGDLTGKQIH